MQQNEIVIFILRTAHIWNNRWCQSLIEDMKLQSAFRICRFHIHGFNQLWIKNIRKKIPESSKRQNLNLPCLGNYLYGIYIVLGFLKFLFQSILDLRCCVSDTQQSDLLIHIHICILFQMLFLYTLLQSIEQSSLCYTLGPC